jgi:hypothetical protein
MSKRTMRTLSGGTISLGYVNDRFNGIQYLLEIDQSDNIKNGQDSASIVISHNEIINLRDSLTEFLEALEDFQRKK